MTLPLQSRRAAPWLFAMLLLACGPAQAQDGLAELKERALEAAISGMNTANYQGNIRYDGQPGNGAEKMGQLTEEFFEHKNDYHFVSRRGKSPSLAVDAIFKGPTKLECNSMMIAIEYKAIKAAIGEQAFDKNFGGRRRVRIEWKAAKTARVIGRYLRTIRRPTLEKVEPGDWVYFANHPDYLYKHPAGAWQGENALCVGKNADGELLFSGFGVNEVTADEMNLELLKAYNAPRSSEDLERDVDPEDEKRLEWLKQNSVVAGTTEEEAVASAAEGLDLDEDDFDYDVIDDSPGAVLIAVFWEPTPVEYPDQITLDEVTGLVQCFRLRHDRLLSLIEEPATTAAATSAAANGLGGALGALGH